MNLSETTEAEQKQAFLNLVLKEDRSELIAHWRKHFPGWKWWLFGPENPVVLPDDGKDEA